MAFKFLKGLAPSSLNDRFIKRSDIHNRNTRNKDLLQIPKTCPSAGLSAVFCIGQFNAVWNNLPKSVKCIDSFSRFKVVIKNIFVEN